MIRRNALRTTLFRVTLLAFAAPVACDSSPTSPGGQGGDSPSPGGQASSAGGRGAGGSRSGGAPNSVGGRVSGEGGTQALGGEAGTGGAHSHPGGAPAGGAENPNGGAENPDGGAEGAGGRALGGFGSGGTASGGTASGGGPSGGAGAGGEQNGAGGQGNTAVNGCVVFVDRDGPADDRRINWNFSIAQDEERCLQIALGQAVVWSGNFDFHPLGGDGGTMPTPIELQDSGTRDYEVTFPNAGVYGYYCGAHNEMRGAVLVVP